MKRLIIILLSVLFSYSCTEREKFNIDPRDSLKELNESEVFEIKLGGELAQPDAELSGLTWYKNNLILLPQFPYKFGNGLYASIYYIPKEKLKRRINSKSQLPLIPQKLTLDASGLDKFNWWGSGYEGIVFNGDDVYLVIENFKEKTEGFVVKGNIDFASKFIKLDPTTLVKIKIPNILRNLSEEAITLFNNEVYVFHEINGINVNPNPFGIKLSADLKNQTPVNFPNLEYRVTDATEVGPDCTFWVINYLWPGDIGKIKPQNDVLFSNYGIGQSHKSKYSVERLVELKVSPSGIKFTNRAPIYLQLPENKKSRNWEGIVKLDELGFLMVTDKFPTTILAFIPYPDSN